MEFPTINFTVETSSGKLFERVFTLPADSAFIEPGDNTEHTVALDPVPRDDWADAYAKTDRATFNWSIEGESSGGIEKPLKKAPSLFERFTLQRRDDIPAAAPARPESPARLSVEDGGKQDENELDIPAFLRRQAN